MTQDPEQDLAAFVAAAGLGWTEGANLFTGEVRAVGPGVPAEAVFIEALGEEPPEPYLGAGDAYPCEVDFTVRGAPGNREGARQKARALMAALHRATIAGYTIVLLADTLPEHMGMDPVTQCHEYTFSLTLQWEA
jgi:hypothetical protein